MDQFDELKADLLGNDTLEKQWSAFLEKSTVTGPNSFDEVLDEIAIYFDPLFESIGRIK